LSKLSSDVRSWHQTAVGEAHQAASSEQLTKGQMTKRRRQAAAQKIQMHPVRAAVAAPDSLKPRVIHVP